VCSTLHISTPGDAADVNPVIQFLPHTLQHPMVDSSHFSTQLPSSGKIRKYAMMTHYTLGEFLCLLICSFLLCLSWVLHCRVRKSRTDLWITLYYLEEFRLQRSKTWYNKIISNSRNNSVHYFTWSVIHQADDADGSTGFLFILFCAWR
jgi:hypothetical protein